MSFFNLFKNNALKENKKAKIQTNIKSLSEETDKVKKTPEELVECLKDSGFSIADAVQNLSLTSNFPKKEYINNNTTFDEEHSKYVFEDGSSFIKKNENFIIFKEKRSVSKKMHLNEIDIIKNKDKPLTKIDLIDKLDKKLHLSDKEKTHVQQPLTPQSSRFALKY